MVPKCSWQKKCHDLAISANIAGDLISHFPYIVTLPNFVSAGILGPTSLSDADVLARKPEIELLGISAQGDQEEAGQVFIFDEFHGHHEGESSRASSATLCRAPAARTADNFIDGFRLRYLLSAALNDPQVFEREQQLFSLLFPSRLFNGTTSSSSWESHLLLMATKIGAARNIAPPALRETGLRRAGSAMHTQLRSRIGRKTNGATAAAVRSGRT